MILFALPPHTVETLPAWNGAPLRSWRWAVVADRWSVGVEEQIHTGEWRSSHSLRYAYLGAAATHPASGFYHGYYDGPHHALWIGPLFVNWSPRWCEVCMPEDTSGAVAAFVEAVLGAAMEAA